MNKEPKGKWKLSPKARVLPKHGRREFPAEAFEDRKTKVRMTSYIDLDILEYFKERAASVSMPYQSLINTELRRIMEADQSKRAESVTETLLQVRTLVEAALRNQKD
jgi:predicted DNA binding CopG/RHH family protein